MSKKSYKLAHFRNPHIKVGDEVFLIDGSALTLLDDDKKDETKNYYIVNAYPILTGSKLNLQNIKAKVITINVKNRVYIGYFTVYVQDVIVQIGNAKFRTCSLFIARSLTYRINIV
jgi:acid phosphatase class B